MGGRTVIPRWVVTLARWVTAAGFAVFAWRMTAGGATANDLRILTLVALLCLTFVLAADWVLAGPQVLPADRNVIVGCLSCGAEQVDGLRTCGPDCPRGADLR